MYLSYSILIIIYFNILLNIFIIIYKLIKFVYTHSHIDPETVFAAQSQFSLIIKQCLELIPEQHDRRIFPSIQLITVITAESVERPCRRQTYTQNKRSRKGARGKKH